YPWNDTTWVWKDTQTELLKKGYEPPIHDFSITMVDNGVDITDQILASGSYTFLLIAHRLDKSNQEALKKADEIARFCEENGYGFYCLTSTLQDEIEKLKTELGLSYDFCFTDEITLKTIIRSNPGFVLIREGNILNKWHYNDVPEVKELDANLLSFSLKEQAETSENRLIYALILGFILVVYAFYEFKRP
ncbi:MAG: hypothetical protein LBQ60_20375, partial [Bacteroidales bacterium]|nr:hypothetical protein [Bacteroidales bacterium]